MQEFIKNLTIELLKQPLILILFIIGIIGIIINIYKKLHKIHKKL